MVVLGTKKSLLEQHSTTEKQMSATACNSIYEAAFPFTAMLLQYIEKFFMYPQYYVGNLRSLCTIMLRINLNLAASPKTTWASDMKTQLPPPKLVIGVSPRFLIPSINVICSSFYYRSCILETLTLVMFCFLTIAR